MQQERGEQQKRLPVPLLVIQVTVAIQDLLLELGLVRIPKLCGLCVEWARTSIPCQLWTPLRTGGDSERRSRTEDLLVGFAQEALQA